jgi:mRNA interferase RelE/StbE
MYEVVRTDRFRKVLRKLPPNWQKRILEKIDEVAVNPYASNNNLTKLEDREGFRLRVGDWRVIHTLDDKRLVMLLVELGSRGGIY